MRLSLVPPALLAALLPACGDDDPTGDDLSILALAVVSGQEQSGFTGQPLAQPFLVRVTRGGAAATGESVVFEVLSGGGTLSASTVATGADGTAAATLTLGPEPGDTNNVVTATLAGADGSPVTFRASATDASGIEISSLSADTLVEGVEVTLEGTGFGATPAENVVKVDGVVAALTAASATSLTFPVPALPCGPARDVVVRVESAARAGETTRPLRTGAPLAVGLGRQLVVGDSMAACLRFAATTTEEAYLVGIQSASEVPSLVAPVSVRVVIPPGATPGTPLAVAAGRTPAAGKAMRARAVAPLESPRSRRWSAHTAAESRLLATDLEAGFTRGAAARALRTPGAARATRAALPEDLAVGDTVSIHLRLLDEFNPCKTFDTVLTQVRAVGRSGIWLEDRGNPANGYTEEDFRRLSDQFDDLIYSTNAEVFGPATDLDENGRVAIVVTKEVNAQGGILGFVTGTDFFAAADCEVSNEGEFFYAAAPDSLGQYPLGQYPRAEALADAPFLLAHEMTHVIQLGRRLAGGAVQALWILEGQATLAEEVVGHRDEGREERSNLGLGVALNLDDPESTDWYSNKIVDLALYFGFGGSAAGVPNPRIEGAPEQCSWLIGAPVAGPCLGSRQVYGVPWTLLRYVEDHFDPAPGRSSVIQRLLIDGPESGYAALAAAAGVPADTLLARWAAALYVDDRVPDAAETLEFPSWDLFNIFEGTFGDVQLFETTRLTPTELGFAPFDGERRVRAGSAAYLRLSGAGHPAGSLQVAGLAGQPLDESVQVWVVRLR